MVLMNALTKAATVAVIGQQFDPANANQIALPDPVEFPVCYEGFGDQYKEAILETYGDYKNYASFSSKTSSTKITKYNIHLLCDSV